MKRTITQEKKTFINQLRTNLLNESKTTQKVKTSTINSLLNFSKSLIIIPSSTISGLNLEIIIN